MKHNPMLLKESVDKSLELLEQGKLKGPHISGEFDLNQVCTLAESNFRSVYLNTSKFEFAQTLSCLYFVFLTGQCSS